MAGSTGAPLTQRVLIASKTTLSTSLARSHFGQSITLRARVSAAATGTVTFMDGSTVLGSSNLTGGSATLATSTLAAGSHDITAVYSGDSAFGASRSAVLTEKVNAATTRTTVASSVTTSVFGQPVTFRAGVAVKTPGAGTPTGTVTFKDGTTVLGSAPLVGGLASLSVATLRPGRHSITAVFVCDTGNFAGGPSAALVRTVQKASSRTSLAGPATTRYGQAVTLTAHVTPAALGAGTSTGTVTFMDGSTVLGRGTLVNGVATLQTGSLKKGGHTITAKYAGDTDFVTSTSSKLSIAIQ